MFIDHDVVTEADFGKGLEGIEHGDGVLVIFDGERGDVGDAYLEVPADKLDGDSLLGPYYHNPWFDAGDLSCHEKGERFQEHHNPCADVLFKYVYHFKKPRHFHCLLAVLWDNSFLKSLLNSTYEGARVFVTSSRKIIKKMEGSRGGAPAAWMLPLPPGRFSGD